MTLIGVALAGCAQEPPVRPSPAPAFASEAEAFAAAEEIYRAYNDALNARLQGEDTPDPQTFLTGLALEGDIDAQNALQSWGIRSVGTTTISSFRGLEANTPSTTPVVTAHVCIDVTDLRVVDADGRDVTPADRGDVVAQHVTFVYVGSDPMVADEASADESSC
nr:hypothetical protein [Microbacterium hydrocarbonoxydans]